MVKPTTETAEPDRRAEAANRRSATTRQRLIDAAIIRFRAHGYDATTAAQIAEDAGVTERTFFRHFPTKADVLVANWVRHGDALRAVLADPGDDPLLDLVRTGLQAYAQRVRDEIADALGTVLSVYADRAAFLAIVQTVLGVEDDLAAVIATRTGRSENEFLVRLVANASVGVFRAALRASVVANDMGRFPTLVDAGIRRLHSLYEELQSE